MPGHGAADLRTTLKSPDFPTPNELTRTLEGLSTCWILEAEASTELGETAKLRFIAKAREELPSPLNGPVADFVRRRAGGLADDHARLRTAAGAAPRVTVAPVLPSDVIGLFVLMPTAL